MVLLWRIQRWLTQWVRNQDFDWWKYFWRYDRLNIKGNYIDGDLTGLGKFESEYKVYEGEFYRSIQHGFGKENQFGEEYNGEFKYGTRNGDGTLEWKGDRYFI